MPTIWFAKFPDLDQARLRRACSDLSLGNRRDLRRSEGEIVAARLRQAHRFQST
jgi:hypothetical protein